MAKKNAAWLGDWQKKQGYDAPDLVEGPCHHLRSSFLSRRFPLWIQKIILGKRNAEAFATTILARLNSPLCSQDSNSLQASELAHVAADCIF